MKRVAIFRASLLPISETFIRDQAAALATWEPVLVGLWKVEDGLSTPKVPREIVATGQRSTELRFLFALPIPALVDSFRRLGAHLVHAHFATDAVRAWPSARAAGLPMVVTLHGYDINIRRSWWERGHAGWGMRLYPRRLLRMAQHPQVRFVAVSEALRKRAIAYGIPEQKVCVSCIGVDTRRFHPGGLPPGHRRRRILFIGRMVEKKGPLLMIRAFAQVRARLADAELVMVGAGPLLEDGRALARDLAVPVEWLGARTSDEVLAQIHGARVVCLPSVTASNGDAEGFGLVLLEAQACGVPVVTSALGGATEGLIEGRTGFGVAEGDVDGLVSKLLRFLEDDAFANAASTAAARFVVESFDLQACSRRLEQIFESHCAGAHSS